VGRPASILALREGSAWKWACLGQVNGVFPVDCSSTGSISSRFLLLRSLRVTPQVIDKASETLRRFVNLTRLSIKMLSTGLHDVHCKAIQICDHFNQAGSSLRQNITNLALTHLPRIDISLLRIISQTFPCLTDLYLSCTERLEINHCIGCYEESLQLIIHSPIPDMFPDARELVVILSQ
jgi:hypothetical protein